MKTVLWISRHEMTGPQRADLERVLGGPVWLVAWRETVTELQRLAPLVEASDAVAAVLPPELLGELLRLAGKRPVLRAIAGRVATGRTLTLADGRREPEFDFVHRGWEQILRADFASVRL